MTNTMSLGLFVFQMRGAPIDSYSRQTKARWGSKDPVGNAPTYEFIGAGEDQITIKGTLMRQVTGPNTSLDPLYEQAATGKAATLTDGRGKDLGVWFIEDISADHTHLDSRGEARRLDFTITLKADVNRTSHAPLKPRF